MHILERAHVYTHIRTHKKCAQQPKQSSAHCSTDGKVLMVKLQWYVPILANLCPPGSASETRFPKSSLINWAQGNMVNKRTVSICWSLLVFWPVIGKLALRVRCYHLNCVSCREMHFSQSLNSNTHPYTASQSTGRQTNSWASAQNPTEPDTAADKRRFLM